MSWALSSAGPTNHFTGIHAPKVIVCCRGAAEASTEIAKKKKTIPSSAFMVTNILTKRAAVGRLTAKLSKLLPAGLERSAFDFAVFEFQLIGSGGSVFVVGGESNGTGHSTFTVFRSKTPVAETQIALQGNRLVDWRRQIPPKVDSD